jgi:uncharacterized protein YdaU (DUF1376 family)
MNFIRLYIGDYLRDTGTLTVSEHGAYVLMLLHHYGTEKPLPLGRDLHRLLRAESKADRDAIDSVARRFWVEEDGGLTNHRAKSEMARAEHQRDVNRSVGKLGGRPKGKETESVAESKPNTNPNQTPDTRHQITEIPSEAKASAPAPPPPGPDPSPKDVVYALGLPMLLAAAVPEERGRSFLGLLLRCNAAEAVAEAVQRCAREGAIQPIAYLQGCLKTSKAKASAHSGFASKDYRDGVTEDGTIAI